MKIGSEVLKLAHNYGTEEKKKNSKKTDLKTAFHSFLLGD
jgi:hypothetical protein